MHVSTPDLNFMWDTSPSAEGYVSGLQLHTKQLEKPQHEIPQAATTV